MFIEDGYRWHRNAKGYYYTSMLRRGRKRTVYYHRWLMEQALGRPLLRYEDVHHVDGDKENNDLSNFELRDHLDHCKLHLSRIVPGSNRGFPHRRHRKRGEPRRPVGRPCKDAATRERERHGKAASRPRGRKPLSVAALEALMPPMRPLEEVPAPSAEHRIGPLSPDPLAIYEELTHKSFPVRAPRTARAQHENVVSPALPPPPKEEPVDWADLLDNLQRVNRAMKRQANL